jgi:hypothetical protein
MTDPNEKPASPTQGELSVKALIEALETARARLNLIGGWLQRNHGTHEVAGVSCKVGVDEITAALDRTTLPPTWQPIETAPKDGTFIITRVGRWTRPAVVHWATYEDVTKWGADPEHFMEEDHFCQYWLEVKYDPTEWLPLEALDAFPAPQGTRS